MQIKLSLLLLLFALYSVESSTVAKNHHNENFNGQRRVNSDSQLLESRSVTLEKPAVESSASNNNAEASKASADASTQLVQRRKDDVAGKDVHKRGAFYNGGLAYGAHGVAHHHPHGAAPLAAYWPKNYAAHYGYSLSLPGANVFSSAATSPAFAAHAHAPSGFVKYHPQGFAAAPGAGFHYKSYAAAAPALPAVGLGGTTLGLGNTAIGFSGTGVGFGAPHFGLGATNFAFNGAPAVASGLAHEHAVAAFAPAVAPAVAPLAPVPAPVPAPVSPFVLRPGGAVVSSYNVNYPRVHQKPLLAVPQVTPVHSVAHVAPIHPVQPVQAITPVQPIHSVVQVQQPLKPVPFAPAFYPLHNYFQTTAFVQPPRIPVAPAVPAVPVTPSIPAIPAFPAAPALPAIPAFPAQPVFPAFPTRPAIPTAPAVPSAPPQPVFPLQPPTRPQQTPTFVSVPVQPEAQFPPVLPIPGQSTPEGGSAEAAPQIPHLPPLPAPIPQPELPDVEPTQEPWKPMLTYGPPANAQRPALTLLPPYGSSPGTAYLPPASSAQHYQQYQQQKQQANSLFDNLTDAEVEHIFAQAANLAAQQSDSQHQHHHHHHRTFSHYKR